MSGIGDPAPVRARSIIVRSSRDLAFVIRLSSFVSVTLGDSVTEACCHTLAQNGNDKGFAKSNNATMEYKGSGKATRYRPRQRSDGWRVDLSINHNH